MRKQGIKFLTQGANLVLFSAISLATTVSVNAEPTPIFKPIIGDIENQLPKGMVMRLPSRVNIAQQPKSQLITWKEFVEQGGRRFVNRDYDIPSEFRNGYVYINPGADNTTAYILKQGLSSYPQKANTVAEIDYALANQYVKSGKAIMFNWGGSSGYFQLHGRDTEIRFERPGLGCLRLTCLEAPFMSKEQITRILRSERQIPQKN